MLKCRGLLFVLLFCSLSMGGCQLSLNNLNSPSDFVPDPDPDPNPEPFPTSQYVPTCSQISGQNIIECEIPNGTNLGAWNTIDTPFMLPLNDGALGWTVRIFNRDASPVLHTYHFNDGTACGHGPTGGVGIPLNGSADCVLNEANPNFEGATYDHYRGSGRKDMWLSTRGAALYIKYCSTCHSTDPINAPFSTSEKRRTTISEIAITNALNNQPMMLADPDLQQDLIGSGVAQERRQAIADWLQAVATP